MTLDRSRQICVTLFSKTLDKTGRREIPQQFEIRAHVCINEILKHKYFRYEVNKIGTLV